MFWIFLLGSTHPPKTSFHLEHLGAQTLPFKMTEIFPHNLLKSFTLCSPVQTDLHGKIPWRTELTWGLLFQDDIITVISRVDENWAEGKLGDKVGIFPILFVEVCETPVCIWVKLAQESLCAPVMPESNSYLTWGLELTWNLEKKGLHNDTQFW